MKISINWLKEYISLSESPAEIAALLTNSGLEVSQLEIFDPLKEKLTGLIIGQIRSCAPHPHADKLRCTQVDIGADHPLSIVCGAPNIEIGQKVAVAPVGTTLHPYGGKTFTIGLIKIRGIISEGMLCAEDEIGISEQHETILTLETTLPPGTPLTHYFSTEPDPILTIDLTPNRIDAACHLGIARELRALLDRPLQYPRLWPQLTPTTTSQPHFEIIVHEPQDCPRYACILIQDVTVKPSPAWLQNKLQAIGLHTINNIVDITNLVMHELGQPLHAFDYDHLKGPAIHVRHAHKGEQLTTLDHITRTLLGHELVIADAQGSIALAGILGGEATAIRQETTTILLESAYFIPQAIRPTAKSHKLQTEASFWYERGTDPLMPVVALQRAYQLLHELSGGTLVMHLDYYPTPIEPLRIEVKYEKIEKMIGSNIPFATIQRILSNLDITILASDPTGFIALVPLYRTNITRPEDVIETILRIYGYDKVSEPDKWTATLVAIPDRPIIHQIAQAFSPILVANGYQEICTHSLTTFYDLASFEKEEKAIAEKPIQLFNPLSERMTILRNSLLFSGLEVIAHNIHRKQVNLKLFEFGKTYHQQADQYLEQNELGIWLTGNLEAPNWLRPTRPVTFQDLNTILYSLLARWPIIFSYKPFQHSTYKTAIQAVDEQDKSFMFVGEVATQATQLLGIDQPVFFAKIILERLCVAPIPTPTYQPISKFPAVKRDLSLVLDEAISFEDIKLILKAQQEKRIQDIHVFDVYQGLPLATGKKAYALSFTLQDSEKTLDESTIQAIMTSLREAFQQKLGALIRE